MAITKQRTGSAFDADGMIVNKYDWCGLSTDGDKPTEGVAVNDLFLELDTGDGYYFDGSAWAKIGGE